MQNHRLKQQQQALMQQALLQQQSLYHPGLLAPPQIEPIPSGNLPPGFDPSTCRSVYVGNIHTQVTEPLLQEVFASTGPVEGCKLIRKEKSSYGFIHYFDRRSAALAILSLNGRHLFGQPIKVNWAYASGQREDTSGHYNIFVGDLSPEVTDATLFACFSVYPSCSDARVMWDQKTGRSRGFGFVSFRNQQDAQSAINDLSGKWLGSRQIRCNWATKGAGSMEDKQNSDTKSVVELTNGSSEDGKETTNSDAPENNPQYTTVYVGNLAPEVTQLDLHRHFHTLGAGVIEEVRVQRDKGFGFVRYSTHAEAALAIQMGNAQSILCGKPIKGWLKMNLSRNMVSVRFLQWPWPMMFSIICWLLWKNRCKGVIEGVRMLADDLIHQGLFHFMDNSMCAKFKNQLFQIDKGTDTRWRPPPAGVIRIDTDGSTLAPGATACGGLARDSAGNWVVGFQRRLTAISSTAAELMGILTGLQICKQFQFQRVHVYTDSLEAYHLLMRDGGQYHPLAEEIKEVRRMLGSDWDIELHYVSREAIRCADFLAKDAQHLLGGLVVLPTMHPGCRQYMTADRICNQEM